MRGIAFIAFPGGGLVLSARTPYERELLFHHVKQCANRHGRVRLTFNRQEWAVEAHSGGAATCAGCTKRIEGLVYENAARTLCAPCAIGAIR